MDTLRNRVEWDAMACEKAVESSGAMPMPDVADMMMMVVKWEAVLEPRRSLSSFLVMASPAAVPYQAYKVILSTHKSRLLY